MRYGRRSWTDPEGDLPEAYHHLSYVIFRTDSEDMGIVAARCPDAKEFAAGTGLVDALELDEEAQGYLLDGTSGASSMVVMTRVGLGILDKRYDGHAGLGVYWHLHGRSASLARLVKSGVFGDPNQGICRVSRAVLAVEGEVGYPDVPSYQALQDAWSVLDRAPGEWARCDGNGCVRRRELWNTMEKLADFIGCTLIADEDAEAAERIKCRRPVLLEALLFCLLTEAHTYSATREVTCRVGSLGDLDGEGLALELCYPMEKPEKYRACLDAVHRHLGWVGELGGLELHTEVIPLKRGERQAGKLPQMRLTLEWLHDPVVLSTSDLKARIRFYYENQP